MKKALLLVDLQKDFCKGGALEVRNADEVIDIANKAIKIFNRNKHLIIATKDWHPEGHKSFAVNSNTKAGEIGILNGLEQVWWPVHCVENTSGSEFHDRLNRKYISKIVYKGTDEEVDSYSGFFDNGRKNKTDLYCYLSEHEIQELYVMGLATDYCVKYTVLDAVKLGYKVWLIEDGCRGVNINPDDSRKAVEEMEQAGALLVKLINLT
jgi:nicotinamidase/pyrazinamidase